MFATMINLVLLVFNIIMVYVNLNSENNLAAVIHANAAGISFAAIFLFIWR